MATYELLVPRPPAITSRRTLPMVNGLKQNGTATSFILRLNGILMQYMPYRFKMHLRTKLDVDQSLLDNIPPLPLDKTIVQVFADFLKYLLECASNYIQESEVNGVNLWASIKKDIDFVLSHPNGWDGVEQEKLRSAAVLGGLIPDTPDGHARISFVSEGEASLHFIIQRGELSANLKVSIHHFARICQKSDYRDFTMLIER
jgi:hypothetical protein